MNETGRGESKITDQGSGLKNEAVTGKNKAQFQLFPKFKDFSGLKSVT